MWDLRFILKDERKTLKFSEHKKNITKALESRELGIDEEISLIDGFINQPVFKELTGAIVIGGPTIPMIAAVGNSSGRVYFFALKAILPEVEI